MNFLWKCLNEGCADDTFYRFPGLCRVCTTYEESRPIEIVKRIKHNSDESLYVVFEKVEHAHRPITRKEIKDVAAEQKKMQRHKTQMRKIRQARRREAEAQKDIPEHIHDEHCGHHVDFTDIGESVRGEEE